MMGKVIDHHQYQSISFNLLSHIEGALSMYHLRVKLYDSFKSKVQLTSK
jgi:hypothetical protein